MKGATVVENLAWLHQLCSPVMLQFSVPLTDTALKVAQAAAQITQTDVLIAKSLAKRETNNHLIWFSTQSDKVEVFCQVFYGHAKWKLGVLKAPLERVQGRFVVGAPGVIDGRLAEDQIYAFFAYCLLSGQVVEPLCLKEFRKQMVFQASNVLDPSNLTSRVTRLITTLARMQVSSKKKLTELYKRGEL